MKRLARLSAATAVCLVAVQPVLHAQTKLGDNPGTIDPAAILELEHPHKAFYLTRVSLQHTGDITTIPNPKAGMMVFNTNASLTGSAAYKAGGAGIYYYDGSGWVYSGRDTATASNGLRINNGDVQLGGTLNAATNIDKNGNNLTFTGTGNVGIGTNAPANTLEVQNAAVGSNVNNGEAGQALNVLAATAAGSTNTRAIGARGRVELVSGSAAGQVRGVSGAANIYGTVTGTATGAYFNGNVHTGSTLPAGYSLTGVAADAQVSNAGIAGVTAASNLVGGRFGANADYGAGSTTPARTIGAIGGAATSSTSNIGVIGVANATDIPSLPANLNAGIAAVNAGAGANDRALYADGKVELVNTPAGASSDSLLSLSAGIVSRIAPSAIIAGIKANNGLTRSGDSIQLGGTLSQATTITAGDNNLAVNGSKTTANPSTGLASVLDVTNTASTDAGTTGIATTGIMVDTSTDAGGFRAAWGSYNSGASSNNEGQAAGTYSEAATTAGAAADGTRAVGAVGAAHAYGTASGSQARVIGITGAADFTPNAGTSNFNAIGVNGYTGGNSTGVSVGGHFDGASGAAKQFGVIGTVEGTTPYEVMFDAGLANHKIGLAAVNLNPAPGANSLALYSSGRVRMTRLDGATTTAGMLVADSGGNLSTLPVPVAGNGLSVDADTPGLFDLGGKLSKDASLDGTLNRTRVSIVSDVNGPDGVFKVQNNITSLNPAEFSNNTHVVSVSLDGVNGSGVQSGDVVASETDAYSSSEDYQVIGAENFATTSLQTAPLNGDFIHAIGADGIAFANGTVGAAAPTAMVIGLSGGTAFNDAGSNWNGIGTEGYLNFNNNTSGRAAAGHFDGRGTTAAGTGFGVIGSMDDNSLYQTLFDPALQGYHIGVAAVNHNTTATATDLALYTEGNVQMKNIGSATPVQLLGIDANGNVGTTAGVVSPLVLSGSTELMTPVAVADGMQYEIDVTVVGAVPGDVVSYGIPGAPANNTWYSAYVSASDLVKIRFVNRSGGTVNIQGWYKVKVLQ